MGNDRLPSPQEIRKALIDVFRCGEGEQHFIRTLSAGYGGLYVHWVRGRSQYCPGERCSCQHKKAQRLWKGYAAVERWVLVQKVWIPAVLEITHNLEHCLQGKWERGQVWEISRRQKDSEKESYPVVGKLMPKEEIKNLPPAFDWGLVMQRKFDVLEQLERHHKNPMPKPQIAVISEDPGPSVLQAEAPTVPPSQEQFQALRERMRGFGAIPSTNGHHTQEKPQ
jgi:hypothetical protein